MSRPPGPRRSPGRAFRARATRAVAHDALAAAVALVASASWTAPAGAQEAAGAGDLTDTGAGEPAVELRPLTPGPRALTLAVADAVVRWANGARRAELDLRWSLIPVDSLVRAELLRNPRGVRVETFWLPNERLMEARRRSGARSPEAGALRAGGPLLDAALSGDLRTFDVAAWDSAFLARWAGEGGRGRTLVEENGLVPPLYYGLLRDHARLAALLRSAGFRFTLDVEGLERPRTVDRRVVWRIRRYTLRRRLARGDTGLAVPVPRYAVDARAGGVEITLPESDAERVAFRVEGRWLDTLGASITRPPALSFGGGEVVVEEATSRELEELERTGADSYLETLLVFGGGAALGEIATRGLLGGTRHASFLSGALLGEEDVKPVVGATLEAWPRRSLRPALALGIDPTGGDTFYAGAGVSGGPIHLSVGYRLSELEGREDVSGRWAGALSFDLSRLLGRKTRVTELAVESPVAGGGWDAPAGAVARSLGLVRLTVEVPGGGEVTFARTRTAAGDSTAAGERTRFVVTRTVEDQLRFLPLGTYLVRSGSGDRVLSTSDGFPCPCELTVASPWSLMPAAYVLETAPGSGAGREPGR